MNEIVEYTLILQKKYVKDYGYEKRFTQIIKRQCSHEEEQHCENMIVCGMMTEMKEKGVLK